MQQHRDLRSAFRVFVEYVSASRSHWIQNHPRGLSALQLETPVAHTFSKHPRQHFPSFCQLSEHAWDETWDIPPPSHNHHVPLLLLLPTFSFLLPPSLSVFPLEVHYSRPLKCSTSNVTTVQVDVFHCPLHRHQQPHAHKQRQSIWMEQLPGRLKHVSIMRKKLADFIKDFCVNKRTGCPD